VQILVVSRFLEVVIKVQADRRTEGLAAMRSANLGAGQRTGREQTCVLYLREVNRLFPFDTIWSIGRRSVSFCGDGLIYFMNSEVP
jgi:hypothetical protein